jgi:hypothetical protein
MRNTALFSLAVLGLAGWGSHVANAQFLQQPFTVQLQPKDPKYNSTPCQVMRAKMKTYKNGMFEQSPGTYIIAGVMPGGSLGFFAIQQRKDDLFRRDIERACMTNPPDRRYLDPNAPNG